MKERIWELDALRGAALLGMIDIHLVYDLVDLFGVVAWQQPTWYLLFKNNYGALFLLISGISVTLGRHCLKRGLTVFCCGFLCTAATVFMYLTGLAGKDIIIYFGVLHCLGCCMLLWPVFRRSPQWPLAALGVLLVGLGLWLRGEGFSFPWLMPLGLALVHSCVGLYVVLDVLASFGSFNVLTMLLFIAFFLLVIYGGYFLLTCWGAKRVVRERVQSA